MSGESAGPGVLQQCQALPQGAALQLFFVWHSEASPLLLLTALPLLSASAAEGSLAFSCTSSQQHLLAWKTRPKW